MYIYNKKFLSFIQSLFIVSITHNQSKNKAISHIAFVNKNSQYKIQRSIMMGSSSWRH